MKSKGRCDHPKRGVTPESSLGIYKAKNWWNFGGGGVGWGELDKYTTRVGYSANVSQLPTVKQS